MQSVCEIFSQAISAFRQLCFAAEAALGIVQTLRQKQVLDHFIGLINDMARNNRRLFITSDGCVGCGSKGLAIADRLALVAGVPAPLVLRPADPNTSDWFETENAFVYSAFVLGWMDGSAFKPDIVGEIQLV